MREWAQGELAAERVTIAKSNKSVPRSQPLLSPSRSDLPISRAARSAPGASLPEGACYWFGPGGVLMFPILVTVCVPVAASMFLHFRGRRC